MRPTMESHKEQKTSNSEIGRLVVCDICGFTNAHNTSNLFLFPLSVYIC